MVASSVHAFGEPGNEARVVGVVKIANNLKWSKLKNRKTGLRSFHGAVCVRIPQIRRYIKMTGDMYIPVGIYIPLGIHGFEGLSVIAVPIHEGSYRSIFPMLPWYNYFIP